MAKRKGATKSTPVKDLTKEESIVHYNAVMIEDLKSSIQLVAEGVEATRRSLENKFNQGFDDMKERIKFVYDSFNHKIESFHQELKKDMHQMEVRLTHRIDHIAERIDDHEERITTIETNQA